MVKSMIVVHKLRPKDLAFLLFLPPFFVVLAFVLPLRLMEDRLSLVPFGLIFLGSQLVLNSKNFGRSLIQLGFFSILGITLVEYFDRPAICLIAAVLVLGGVFYVQSISQSRERQRNRHELKSWLWDLSYWMLLFHLGLILFSHFLVSGDSPLVVSVTLYTGIVSLFIFFLACRGLALSGAVQLLLQAALLTLLLSFYKFGASAYWQLAGLIIAWVPVLLLSVSEVRFRFRQDLSSIVEAMFRRPEGAVVIFFASLCLLGTLALISPLSAAGKMDISFVDAAFTAVSAACVTGLVVLDTASDFSFFGQFMILLLIQAGGLGIMALSSILLLFLKHRLSVSEEQALIEVMGSNSSGLVFTALRQVLLVTFTFEFAGTLILTAFFIGSGEDFLNALWRGVFTAISAFCNAGFALQADSLVAFRHNPVMLHTVGVLVIAGGLSPAFIVAMPKVLRGARPTLQYRLVAYGNILLLMIGAVFYLMLEWNHSLMGLELIDKVHNAWFQSITSRTAGFNSVDLTTFHPGTIFVMMALMFVGGSPGGTAGGIKITTFMVLVNMVHSVSKGLNQPYAFHRNISKRSIYQAATVISCGLLIGYLGLTALLTTQRIDPLIALFEIVSAAGTVGLSIGATTQLDGVGKLIIMLVMFLGRVGSISIILFLGLRSDKEIWGYASEDVSAV